MPNEFTVQELMGLLGRLGPKDYLSVWITTTHWALGRRYGETLATAGSTPDGLRNALEERAVPTAEEALDAVHVLIGRLWGDHATRPIEFDTVRRFIEAHKEQPDGTPVH